MIEINNVSFSYGESVEGNFIKNLSISIPKGQVVVLCGESGCGKTTVTRLINGLIPNFFKGNLSGSVTVDGVDITKKPLYEIAENTGSVFQNPRSQFFNVDTDSELSFALENLGFPKEEIVARVDTTVRDFKIERLLGKSLFKLSGGEKQIIACASVSVTTPDIIILDEPSSNLDTRHIAILKDIIKNWKEQGKTVVISEHRLYYLADIADRFICLDKGSVLFDLPKNELEKHDNENLNKMGLRTLNPFKLTYVGSEIETKNTLILKDFIFSYKNEEKCLNIKELIVPKGEVIGIIGTNGTAKSTFGRSICGLEKVGTLIDGTHTLSHKDRLKSCYMVMQDVNHQLFTETVSDELAISMAEHNEENILTILDSLSLSKHKDRHPMSLSGGEKQRVAIATAIAADREYIIFDEPTSGLDFKHMGEVAECINSLKQAGKTVFVITHDIELIYQCCNHIIHIENGQVANQFNINNETFKDLIELFSV